MISDGELEAQPEPSQAQQNMQVSGEARWARHNNNTWHAKNCKLHTVMRGGSAAVLEAGAVVASAVVEARLIQQIEAWVEACTAPQLAAGPHAVEAVLAASPDLHAGLDAVPRYEHDANTVDDVGRKLETSFANSLTVLFPRRLEQAVALAGARVIAGSYEHQRCFGVPLGSGRVLRPTLFSTLTSSEVQKLSAAQELAPKTWPAPHPDDAMLDQRHAAPSASAGGHSARPPSLAHFLDAVLDHAGPEQGPGPPSLAHMLVSEASGPATPAIPTATAALSLAAQQGYRALRRAGTLQPQPNGNGRRSSSNSSSMAVTSSSTNATSASHAGTSTSCTNASSADVCHTMRMHTRSSSIAGWHASKRGSKVWERDEAAPESSSNGSLVHVAVHVPHGDVMSDGSCPTLRPTTSTSSTTTRVNSAGDTAIGSLSSSSTCSPLTQPPQPCAAARPAPPLPLPLDKLLQLPVYHPRPQLLHGARHQQLLSLYQTQPQSPPPVLPTSMQTQAT
ncbi:hypothetical protein QJQ45_028409, partial [Haematococcus lacustris]